MARISVILMTIGPARESRDSGVKFVSCLTFFFFFSSPFFFFFFLKAGESFVTVGAPQRCHWGA